MTWVDQRRGVVWINLGRADGLQPLTTFSVYPEKPTSVTKESAKASIEVTAIRGEHEAEARIMPGDTSKLADPIMPRDKIYSPVWSRGTKKHFALAGFMDIDGDGRSDLAGRPQPGDRKRRRDRPATSTRRASSRARSPRNQLSRARHSPDGRNAAKDAVDSFSRRGRRREGEQREATQARRVPATDGLEAADQRAALRRRARPADTAIKPSDNPPRSRPSAAQRTSASSPARRRNPAPLARTDGRPSYVVARPPICELEHRSVFCGTEQCSILSLRIQRRVGRRIPRRQVERGRGRGRRQRRSQRALGCIRCRSGADNADSGTAAAPGEPSLAGFRPLAAGEQAWPDSPVKPVSANRRWRSSRQFGPPRLQGRAELRGLEPLGLQKQPRRIAQLSDGGPDATATSTPATAADAPGRARRTAASDCGTTR